MKGTMILPEVSDRPQSELMIRSNDSECLFFSVDGSREVAVPTEDVLRTILMLSEEKKDDC